MPAYFSAWHKTYRLLRRGTPATTSTTTTTTTTITGDHSLQDQILLVKMVKYIPGRFLYYINYGPPQNQYYCCTHNRYARKRMRLAACCTRRATTRPDPKPKPWTIPAPINHLPIGDVTVEEPPLYPVPTTKQHQPSRKRYQAFSRIRRHQTKRDELLRNKCCRRRQE